MKKKRRLRLERDWLVKALKRLASPEAFLHAGVATAEETARMRFAELASLGPTPEQLEAMDATDAE